jgi:subtilisin family serine protease
MKKGIPVALAVLAICFLTSYAAWAQIAPSEQHVRKIVTFQPGFTGQSSHARAVERHGGAVSKHLGLINAAAVHVPLSRLAELAAESGVLRIDDDIVIRAVDCQPGDGAVASSSLPAGGVLRVRPSRLRGGPGNTPKSTQVTPSGIAQIDAPAAWAITTGAKVKVALLDTGIDYMHPDLAANIKGGANIVSFRRPASDDNGHGTHVAGIVAALNNMVGVVGVGPNIELYNVKVLGADASGMLSDIIAGLDWCVTNHMQVVNMSLETTEDNQAFHDAITKAYQAGLVMVAAAGNYGAGADTVEFPARYGEVIAVSAVDSTNNLAWFSSVGPEVALAAPGVAIRSCYLGDGYMTLSGTSMASPHVAGVAALIISTPVGSYDTNGNGIWDPDEVKARLMATAQNLNLLPTQQGAGLVRADLAVR